MNIFERINLADWRMCAMVDDEPMATLNTSPCDDCDVERDSKRSWGMCKCCSYRTFSPDFEVEAEESASWQADPAVIKESYQPTEKKLRKFMKT